MDIATPPPARQARYALASSPPQGEGISRASGAARPSSKRWPAAVGFTEHESATRRGPAAMGSRQLASRGATL